MEISYNRMVDSPIGSLLGCYVFNGVLTKDKALKMFKKADSKGDIPTPADINEAYNAWIEYFKLPDADNIMAFRNQYTFRFAPFIANKEGEYGFFPLQDDGVYTFFERMFVNTQNAIILKRNTKKKKLEKPKKDDKLFKVLGEKDDKESD